LAIFGQFLPRGHPMNRRREFRPSGVVFRTVPTRNNGAAALSADEPQPWFVQPFPPF
jgi:hypothetical protein